MTEDARTGRGRRMTDEQPQWFRDWLEADHHLHPSDDGEGVPLGEAERRLSRRARILDWTQILFMAVVPPLFVVVVVALFFVLGAAHHVDKRAQGVADSNAALAQAVKQQSDSQDQLRRIAEALGKLETARTADEKQAALDALREASAGTTTTTGTTAAPQKGRTTTTAPATTAQPPAATTTTTTTTTVTAGPTTTAPPPPGPTVPCLLPRSAICPGGP